MALTVQKTMAIVNEFVGELIRHRLTPMVLPVMERNLIPDVVIRFGIQRELEMELQRINKMTTAEKVEKTRAFVKELKTMPIAVQQQKANEQHYEVPG